MKEYVKPTAKLFNIRMEERIAAQCGGGSEYILIPDGCNEILVGERTTSGDCTFGEAMGS